MIKYYIIRYEKQHQSFLSALNSMTMSNGGNIQEPYTLILNKKGWFGLVNKIVKETIYLPRGFDADKEFTKGRQYIK